MGTHGTPWAGRAIGKPDNAGHSRRRADLTRCLTAAARRSNTGTLPIETASMSGPAPLAAFLAMSSWRMLLRLREASRFATHPDRIASRRSMILGGHCSHGFRSANGSRVSQGGSPVGREGQPCNDRSRLKENAVANVKTVPQL